MSSPPTTPAACHGMPDMIACPGVLPRTSAPLPEVPLVVDPAAPDRAAASGEATLPAATDTTAPSLTVVSTAAPAPAPNSASSTPTARRATPLVAITAIRPARAASASASASGTRSVPDTLTTSAVSGFCGLKTACAHCARRASSIRPAPTPPASSAYPYSRFGLVIGRRRPKPEHGVEHVGVEAGPVAGVAGGPHLVHPDQDGVAVAVKRDRPDPLLVAGALALDPVLLAAARPVRAAAGGERAVQRLVVHPGDHQHLAGVVLLRYRGHQAVGVALEPGGDLRVQIRRAHRVSHRCSLFRLLCCSQPTRHRRQILRPPAGNTVTVTYSRDERLALAALLEETGPDAPTLCAGWQTRDLAAHLVLRERRPDAGAGMMGGPLAAYTARLQRQYLGRYSYPKLIELFTDGPPRPAARGIGGRGAG